MKVTLGDDKGHVTIAVKERSLDNALRFSVAASCEGFSGQNRDVRIESDAFTTFVKDFWLLEQARDGEAWLRSISPNEFVLRCYTIDSAGHMALDVSLQRRSYNSAVRVREQQLAISCELPSDRMVDVLRHLDRMLSYAEGLSATVK